jgi:hypothetical protein
VETRRRHKESPHRAGEGELPEPELASAPDRGLDPQPVPAPDRGLDELALPPELALLFVSILLEYFYTKIRFSTPGSAPTC